MNYHVVLNTGNCIVSSQQDSISLRKLCRTKLEENYSSSVMASQLFFTTLVYSHRRIRRFTTLKELFVALLNCHANLAKTLIGRERI